jgi:hypothetical protein
MKPELEIITGWDVYHHFAVIHWGRHRDSGCLLSGFQTRQEAVAYACIYARDHDCNLTSADLVTFTKGARA